MYLSSTNLIRLRDPILSEYLHHGPLTVTRPQPARSERQPNQRDRLAEQGTEMNRVASYNKTREKQQECKAERHWPYVPLLLACATHVGFKEWTVRVVEDCGPDVAGGWATILFMSSCATCSFMVFHGQHLTVNSAIDWSTEEIAGSSTQERYKSCK